MNWIELIANWLPIILLIGVFVWIGRRYQNDLRGKSGLTHGQYLEEILLETRAHNARLEKLIERMDARIAALESRRT